MVTNNSTDNQSIKGDSGTANGYPITFNGLTNAGATVKFTGSGSTISLSTSDSNSVTLIGLNAGNSSYTGTSDTGIGSGSLAALTSGQFNVAIGDGSLHSLTSGSFNCAMGTNALLNLTTGDYNMGIGQNCIGTLTTGSANTAIGYAALSDLAGSAADNTAIGYLSMVSCTGGASNTCIGYAAGFSYDASESNNILIGASVFGTAGESDVIRIGVPGTQTKCVIAGISGEVSSSGIAVLINSSGVLGTSTSSIRFKEDVQDMGDRSSKLLQCRPVTFRYKKDEEKRLQYGMIAEEVLKIMPELISYDLEGYPQAIRYDQMISMLVNEVNKLNKRVEELENKGIIQ